MNGLLAHTWPRLGRSSSRASQACTAFTKSCWPSSSLAPLRVACKYTMASLTPLHVPIFTRLRAHAALAMRSTRGRVVHPLRWSQHLSTS